MMDRTTRLGCYADIVQRLSGALRAASLYSLEHPSVDDHVRALLEAVQRLHEVEPSVLIGLVGGEVIADDTPLLAMTSYRAEFIRYMQALGINRVLLNRGVTLEELRAFVRAASQPGTRTENGGAEVDVDFLKLAHLRAGRIPVDTTAGNWGSSAVTMRQVYSGSVEAARMIWESTRLEGVPDAPMANETVEHLAEAVGTSQARMIGLTGMKEHDEYTFTHMVNVSILTMAQARTLGIEGRQLRALGLAAMLHDIGKVLTPVEVLNKPGTLTPAELAIMRRHPLDGAAILRGGRDIPRLAAVVAFEHHLRLDGTGYPAAGKRDSLNLASMLCAVADVYDAMRSKRHYQDAFPADRILEVLRRGEGRAFENHLVRRFVQLMGLYPVGSLVRLNTGAYAVVLRPSPGDPRRPRVRVVYAPDGHRLEVTYDVDLWDVEPDPHRSSSVTGPVAAPDAAFDPLTVM
jgi:putative nucleotidyltransferase with HDIG domain